MKLYMHPVSPIRPKANEVLCRLIDSVKGQQFQTV
jgi:hypothetical protein